MDVRLVGTVLDANGIPARGATVWLVSDGDWGARRTTDEHGKFEIRGTVLGPVHVWAHSGTQASPRTTVELVMNNRVEVALKLQESSIAGTVVDTNGMPVPAVEVNARPKDSHYDAGPIDRSDARGHFAFGGLPPGDYEIYVVYRPGEQRQGWPSKGQPVKSGDFAVRVPLPELVSVSGRVVLDGRPVPSFGIVVANRGDEMQWRQSSPNPISAPDGRFALRVPAGPRTLVVFGRGVARKLIDVDVKDDVPTELGDVVVDHGQRVSGHVTDAKGDPVEGATVAVIQMAPVRHTNLDPFLQSLHGGGVATTDASGAFQIDGISPPTTLGERPRLPNRIGASHPDRGIAPARDLPDAEATADLVLKPTGGLDGKLVGPASDHVFVWAQLANHTGESVHAQIESDRSFHFDKLAVGDYELRITRQNWDGYVMEPTLVTVAADKRAKATITVLDSVTLRVHVIDGKCQVGLLLKPGADPPDQARELGHSFCDGDHVDIRNVPPGEYRVCVDEKHCAQVTATAKPAMQRVDLHASP